LRALGVYIEGLWANKNSKLTSGVFQDTLPVPMQTM
jgi:hypothetical protein